MVTILFSCVLASIIQDSDIQTVCRGWCWLVRKRVDIGDYQGISIAFILLNEVSEIATHRHEYLLGMIMSSHEHTSSHEQRLVEVFHRGRLFL
ncbi:hypothetical protein F5051DRAFT_410660 [Lentinula edodes]|nr:hypothetical protein F5051DRAFT_410660 [Lentinula edodes]